MDSATVEGHGALRSQETTESQRACLTAASRPATYILLVHKEGLNSAPNLDDASKKSGRKQSAAGLCDEGAGCTLAKLVS